MSPRAFLCDVIMLALSLMTWLVLTVCLIGVKRIAVAMSIESAILQTLINEARPKSKVIS